MQLRPTNNVKSELCTTLCAYLDLVQRVEYCGSVNLYCLTSLGAGGKYCKVLTQLTNQLIRSQSDSLHSVDLK